MSPQTDLIEVFWDERDALFRYATKILRDPQDAEDALHDCYLRLVAQPETISMIRQRRAWVFRVVRNLCIDRLRKQRRQSDPVVQTDIAQHLHVAGSQMVTPERQLESSDALKRAYASISRLPPDEAQTLSLAVVEGLSYEDIAFITDVPVGTVRSRLNRARRMLRDLVDTGDPVSPKNSEAADDQLP
ncbi:MAG: RNA polymerase sigma factor [Pseudomonadota bacterium]